MYACLADSDKVRVWFKTGRGLRVWQSADLGAGRADMLTPGDCETSPHWAYPIEHSRVYQEHEVTFYERLQVVKDWTSSPSGWNAAQRWIDKHGAPREREAPIGRVLSVFMVEELSWNTDQTTPCYKGRRPLGTRYRVSIVEWSAIIKAQVNA